MGKLIARLFIVVLLGLTAYLYIQVVELQRDNAALRAEAAQIDAVRRENAALHDQLARQQIALAQAQAAASSGGWLGAAQAHAEAAERELARGNLRAALGDGRAADSAIGRAADEASSQTRGAVAAAQARVAALQKGLKSAIRRFGG